MRKLILIGLSCTILLSGCGKAVSENEQQVLTVVLWDYDKTSYDQALIHAFEEENPDVHVEVISYPDAYYDTKMETLLSGERKADVFIARTADSLQKLIKNNIVYPLDEWIESESWRDIDLTQFMSEGK
ncbi:MAG: extracellular solute-binding protein [Lachnospiraceae bacterium]|nr:extracellular solute-binding protein [Lachnospiraceae bacterium]